MIYDIHGKANKSEDKNTNEHASLIIANAIKSLHKKKQSLSLDTL